MRFLVCLHKIIQSCESPSLESNSLEVPLTFFHNALCPVVLCKVLKRLNFFNFKEHHYSKLQLLINKMLNISEQYLPVYWTD